MKYKRIYLLGREHGKKNEDDFVVGYAAGNGKYIETVFNFDGSIGGYKIDGQFYRHLAEAKSACESEAEA